MGRTFIRTPDVGLDLTDRPTVYIVATEWKDTREVELVMEEATAKQPSANYDRKLFLLFHKKNSTNYSHDKSNVFIGRALLVIAEEKPTISAVFNATGSILNLRFKNS